MKKIRYLTVRFDADILLHEVAAFRGAIIAKVGPEWVNFHNHLSDGQFQYRYPVIQYKRIGRNPAIVCVEAGTDDIQQLFQQRTWEIRLGDRPLTLTVRDLRLHHYTLQAWEHTFRFQLRDWLALNEANYARYQHTPDEVDRLELLERVLRGNILSMAKGLEWYVDREVRVRILHCSPLRWLPYKSQRLAAFDLEFATNVSLPDWLGLGKGVSIGFGTVTRLRDKSERTRPNDTQPSITFDDEY